MLASTSEKGHLLHCELVESYPYGRVRGGHLGRRAPRVRHLFRVSHMSYRY